MKVSDAEHNFTKGSTIFSIFEKRGVRILKNKNIYILSKEIFDLTPEIPVPSHPTKKQGEYTNLDNYICLMNN